MTYPAQPALEAIGERLQERTAPLAPDDATYGHAHAYLCGSLGAIFGEVAAIFDPDGDMPPMAPLFDPDLCPLWALPWVAQLVGTTVPDGMAEADARTFVREVAGFARGSSAAMRAAAGLFLTGTKTVYFRERNSGNAYSLQVVTRTSETPDAAAVLRALTALKPGGIVLDYHTVAGWDYAAMNAAGGTYTTLAGKFYTYNDLRDNTPH